LPRNEYISSIPLYFEDEKCIFDAVDSPEKMNVDQLFKHSSYGLYKVDGNKIEIRYDANTEFEFNRIFSMLSSDIILDENLREYKYVAYDF